MTRTPVAHHKTPQARWFERLTGFAETTYAETRSRLDVKGNRLISRVNGASYGIDAFELVSLGQLRRRVAALEIAPRRSTLRVVQGEARALHCDTRNAGGLFQVASQFNMLEMVGPHVTPEHGVTNYYTDHTQGPACAMAAGAATIYRNYFVPLRGQTGQTADVQLNGFEALGTALARATDRDPSTMFVMRNGYLSCSAEALDAVNQLLARLDDDALDGLGAELAIGLHWNVEVTAADDHPRRYVSQAFCSAVPVDYNRSIAAKSEWRLLAGLVLEAAYEATLLAGAINAHHGGTNRVLLTLLGGGAFGNEESWILRAIDRAFAKVANLGLDVVAVSYGSPSSGLVALAKQ